MAGPVTRSSTARSPRARRRRRAPRRRCATEKIRRPTPRSPGRCGAPAGSSRSAASLARNGTPGPLAAVQVSARRRRRRRPSPAAAGRPVGVTWIGAWSAKLRIENLAPDARRAQHARARGDACFRLGTVHPAAASTSAGSTLNVVLLLVGARYQLRRSRADVSSVAISAVARGGARHAEPFARLRRTAQQQRERDRRDQHEHDHEHGEAEPASTPGLALVGDPPASLGSITGLAASARAASVFALTARSNRPSGCASLMPTALAYERMKPRTKTWAGKLESAPASSCSIADRGTFVDAEMSPIVSARLLALGAGSFQNARHPWSRRSPESSCGRVFFNVFG